MLNAIQLILLLPLIGAHMPKNVLAFIRGLSFSMLDFDYFSLVDPHNDSKNSLDFDQDNTYLYLIDLESGSTLVNTMDQIGILMLVPAFHSIIALLHWYYKNQESQGK